MSYTMHALSGLFAELGEEVSMVTVQDFLDFERLPGEKVDALLARFDEMRVRATTDGGMQINVPHTAVTLLLQSQRSFLVFKRLGMETLREM